MKHKLRNNQLLAINTSIENDFSSGIHYHATGCGKSWIAIHILMEFNIKRDICLPLVKPGCALDDMILPGEVDLSDIKGKGLVPS